MHIPRFTSLEQSLQAMKEMSAELKTDEVTIVGNPSYIYRPFDVYILPTKIDTPRNKLTAIVKDMDGTTTTTEDLCVHSLEFMVGKITGWDVEKGWSGLDHEKDHPHIIGNSTTKHVEYLIKTYGDGIVPDEFRRAYMFAVLWTLCTGKDPGRREEVMANLSYFGLGGIKSDDQFLDFINNGNFSTERARELSRTLTKDFPGLPRLESFEDRVRAAIDVYYQRYHEILAAIDEGKGRELAGKILSDPDSNLIEPMPGVAVFLAAVKGWLGDELSFFGNELKDILIHNELADISEKDIDHGVSLLSGLGKYFEKNPVRVAIVTSSIAYEAKIVLTEVFKILYRQAEKWEISASRKEAVLNGFRHYSNTYDAFITATDSSEIRLKPHPDLYSLALHRMGVGREDFDSVIGFEDSESGTRAIRAAGVGLCVALPFPFTRGQDLSAASHILHGGLPEALIGESLFLDHSKFI